jgi:hypothetical protein
MWTTKHGTNQKGRTTFRLFSLLVLLAVCLGLTTIPLFTVLVIRDTETNQIVWSGSVSEDTPFAIRWTHSIHRSPVVEYYRVQGKQIRLYEMSFKDYGIGMSSELAPGEKLVTRDGAFHVENMNHVFPALRLFIGQVRANHTLLFDGKEIPLASVDAPGKAITIQVETHSIIQTIGGY